MKKVAIAIAAFVVTACVEKKVEPAVDAGVPAVVGAGTNMTGPTVPEVVVKPAEPVTVKVEAVPALVQSEVKEEVKPAAVQSVPAPVPAEVKK